MLARVCDVCGCKEETAIHRPPDQCPWYAIGECEMPHLHHNFKEREHAEKAKRQGTKT